ncbi:MAG TPA: HEAT repeat domain-containing protein [Blastocatellia bacterium]|nr:HEAT repeat domain-containing protein [Blastocatellia bacterium]
MSDSEEISKGPQDLEDEPGLVPEARRPSRKYPWAILVVVVLFVVVPFISWYGTWFGRPLSDAKLIEYLHDTEKPRSAQHALSQLAERIEKGDPAAKRFYPEIIAAASNPSPEVRLTAAWVMGQDNHEDSFHNALLTLVDDPVAGVRHNAALSLVRFGDSRARRELVAMLEPVKVLSPATGTLEVLAKEEGMAVAAGGPLARIKLADGSRNELKASEARRVEVIQARDGDNVEEGQELMTLLPSTEQVWEALRALFLIGQQEDIAAIQRYTRPLSGMPDRVRQQAIAAIEEIRRRASNG